MNICRILEPLGEEPIVEATQTTIEETRQSIQSGSPTTKMKSYQLQLIYLNCLHHNQLSIYLEL
jgi:hypothetical protein